MENVDLPVVELNYEVENVDLPVVELNHEVEKVGFSEVGWRLLGELGSANTAPGIDQTEY